MQKSIIGRARSTSRNSVRRIWKSRTNHVCLVAILLLSLAACTESSFVDPTYYPLIIVNCGREFSADSILLTYDDSVLWKGVVYGDSLNIISGYSIPATPGKHRVGIEIVREQLRADTMCWAYCDFRTSLEADLDRSHRKLSYRIYYKHFR
jgi:hypothetical protein